MKKKVIFYEDERNRKPVEEFLNELDLKSREKIIGRILLLEKGWNRLRRPYVDILVGGFYELRVIFSGNQIRVIYAYLFKDYIVLLHGMIKKTNEVPQEDIQKALNRMYAYQARYSKGLVELPKI